MLSAFFFSPALNSIANVLNSKLRVHFDSSCIFKMKRTALNGSCIFEWICLQYSHSYSHTVVEKYVLYSVGPTMALALCWVRQKKYHNIANTNNPFFPMLVFQTNNPHPESKYHLVYSNETHITALPSVYSHSHTHNSSFQIFIHIQPYPLIHTMHNPTRKYNGIVCRVFQLRGKKINIRDDEIEIYIFIYVNITHIFRNGSKWEFGKWRIGWMHVRYDSISRSIENNIALLTIGSLIPISLHLYTKSK